MKMKPVALLVFVLINVICNNAATTYYVSPFGHDSDTGKDEANPFQTIQRAVSASTNTDTIILLPGLYTGPKNSELQLSSQNFKLMAKEKGEAVISCLGSSSYGIRIYGRGITSVTLENLGIQDCGTAVTFYYGGSFGVTKIVNVEFTDNKVDIDASGTNYANDIQVISSTFIKSGKAFVAKGNKNILIDNCHFKDISTNSLYIQDGTNININNNVFINSANLFMGACTSSYYRKNRFLSSGSLLINRGNVVIENSEFYKNDVQNGTLSVINSIISVSNITFTGNTARLNGGGIYCLDSSGNIFDNKFLDNRASHNGGAFYCDGCKLFFRNNLYSNNYPEWSSSLCPKK